MITLRNIGKYDSEINEVLYLLDKTKIHYTRFYFRDEYQLNNDLYNCYTGNIDYIEAFEYAVINLKNILEKVKINNIEYQNTDYQFIHENVLYSIKIIYNIISACNEYIISTYTHPDKAQKAIIRKSNFINNAKKIASRISIFQEKMIIK